MGNVRPLRRLVEALTDESMNVRHLTDVEIVLVSGRHAVRWIDIAPELDRLAPALPKLQSLGLILPSGLRGNVRIHQCSLLLSLPQLHTLNLDLAFSMICLQRLLDVVVALPCLRCLTLEGLALWPAKAAQFIGKCNYIQRLRLEVEGFNPPESLLEEGLPSQLHPCSCETHRRCMSEGTGRCMCG